MSMAAKTSLPRTAVEFEDIVRELISELGSVSDGFVELRIYKTNNALENHDFTTHKRSKGKIHAAFATN